MNQNLLYYNCTLFDEKIVNIQNFSFVQEEILLKNKNEKNSIFEKIKVEYNCKFTEYNNFDWTKPIGIICIKDNLELLSFTLNNLKEYEIYKYISFIVVDDRSTEDIKSITNKFPVSYLRVDNKKGFNFSALNNIAAKIAFQKGSQEIVLWNSDLWVHDEKTVGHLLELHKKSNSTISGTRLVYPPFSWNGQEISDNIKNSFPNNIKTYRDTIQFGGSYFVLSNQFSNLFPIHRYRFKQKNYKFSDENRNESFITGAFQIIDLNWFIDNGGLNQSLSKNFQDVDLCLRAITDEKNVMYFGKDNYLYHDESVLLSKNKNDHQLTSDHVLYCKIWDNQKLAKIILGG